MKTIIMRRVLLLLLGLFALLLPARALAAEGAVFKLDCQKLDCKGVLPGAVKFEKPKTNAPYRIGQDTAGKLVGWVVLSTDVVDVKAYSGKPLVTLVGLTPKGVISGAKVIHHSEPILLVGIPESALLRFVDFYKGKSATAKIVVGASDDPGTTSVDVISGATVTSLAQNRTILDTARTLGSAVGVVKMASAVPGHFVSEATPWTWQQMLDEDVFGHLSVSQEQMGLSGDQPFIDIYFAIADPPQIGRALLGEHEYEWKMKQLKPGEHILVVLGNGTSSFKGSGFVRGGIFDRVRVEQGLRSVTFHDHDFEDLSGVSAPDAPRFKEGAIFTVRAGRLDLGAPFDLVFLGSHYNQRGGFSRDFKAFRSTFRLPQSEYVLDGPDPNQAIWRTAWKNSRDKSIFLGAYLLLIAGVFAARRWSTGSMKRLQRLHLLALVLSFGLLGVWLRAQPSVTQVLTFVGSVTGHFRWGLFLSEPVIFISWIFIAVVTLVWGRGVFCGWTCPYGALNELVFKLGRVLQPAELRVARTLPHEAPLDALRRAGDPRGYVPVLVRARREARRGRAVQVHVLRAAVDARGGLLCLVGVAHRSIARLVSTVLPLCVPARSSAGDSGQPQGVGSLSPELLLELQDLHARLRAARHPRRRHHRPARVSVVHGVRGQLPRRGSVSAAHRHRTADPQGEGAAERTRRGAPAAAPAGRPGPQAAEGGVMSSRARAVARSVRHPALWRGGGRAGGTRPRRAPPRGQGSAGDHRRGSARRRDRAAARPVARAGRHRQDADVARHRRRH